MVEKMAMTTSSHTALIISCAIDQYTPQLYCLCTHCTFVPIGEESRATDVPIGEQSKQRVKEKC